MGLFDLFKRNRASSSRRRGSHARISRIDHLLGMYHDFLEKPEPAYGGVDFVAFVERQLREGQVDLAIWNISSQVRYYFALANLYWGQGDGPRAETYLRRTLERHQRLVDACADHDLPRPSYRGIECAKCAACLLGVEVEDLRRAEAFEPGYEPWFKDALLSYCLDLRDFDRDAWQASADEWTRKRHPKYRLEEFAVYVKALTGGYESTDAMLGAHAKMFASRTARNPDSDLLDGYDDNDLIVDHIFAAILNRIGWEGSYRHSWPHSAAVGSMPQTTKSPDRFAGVIAAAEPMADRDTGLIGDVSAARRFIDLHLRHQTDFEGEVVDAARPAKDRGKVSGALRDLGWTGDPETLDLMRTYRMDCICNDRTHLSLCDPMRGASITMEAWTRLLSDDFGLHPDFIAIAGSEEKTDYRDPQGAWYCYWKKDRRIYAIDRDAWGDPDVAVRHARPGLNLWPSYSSFVAWWISEHLRSKA
ncbi:MAG: tetratricopeptide repeat protein [Sphingopyxis sp.]|uniref:tetratricopeptide repeat protein n=1 Tax=Sphingopyxis sp. TaxID=1908224 RepID=UPI003D80F0DB